MSLKMNVNDSDNSPSEPLVSVIVPVYNRKKEIQSLIHNLNQQIFKDFEVIFVDDHSLVPLAELFTENHKPQFSFDVLRNPKNRGVSYSRNQGVKKASGQYIAFLDSDDSWYPEKLAKCVQFAKETTGEIFCIGKTKVVKTDYEEFLPLKSPEDYHRGEDYLFLDGQFAQVSSFFLSASLAKKLNFNEALSQYEDYLYFVQAFNHSENIKFIDETLVSWFDDKTDGRLSTQKSYQQAITFIEFLKNEVATSAIAAFYLRFVLPYYFYHNIPLSFKVIYICLTSQKVSFKTVSWMSIKGIIGDFLITKLRAVVKK